MYILGGVVAILLAAVIYGAAYTLYHRQTSPQWARGQLFASVASLLMVGLGPVGAGFIVLGLSEPITPASWAGIACLVAVPLLLWQVRRG
ncbi:hypothetical protein [Thetidibacter halocola]|uniref:Uncharacterized protein n=1 Tax=Thetidibacter halocola TaxID=2827239 RepID=A0A8J7WFL7_9RHOB|nr:hypothetical protein [Thetidibacter halocola]MBS0125474.1 hypothetical protein [Thetidibacter halocola]